METGTLRYTYCKQAKESVDQEWTGKEWLCLHKSMCERCETKPQNDYTFFCNECEDKLT